MALVPSSVLTQRIAIAEGLSLEYRSGAALISQSASKSIPQSVSRSVIQSIVVGILIVDSDRLLNPPVDPLPNLLFIISKNSLEHYLDSQIIASIATLSFPFSAHCAFTDLSLLHLIELLQAELEAPKAMSQPLVASIATVLILDLLQALNRRAERSPDNRQSQSGHSLVFHKSRAE